MRKSTLRSSIIVSVLAVAALSFMSCGDSKNESQNSQTTASNSSDKNEIQGSLTYRLAVGPKSLNPLVAGLPIEQKLIRYHLSMRLLERDPESVRPIPWLAEDFPEISPDGKAHAWTIRKGATWSDGTPVTAHDVQHTWSVLNSNDSSVNQACSGIRLAHADVLGVVALDDSKFEVQYRSRIVRAELPFGLNFPIVPKSACQNPTDDIKQLHLMGCGPYRVASWKDDVITMERKTDWWGNTDDRFASKFKVKEFRYKVIPDELQAIAQIKAGKIDFSALGIENYQALMKQKDSLGLHGNHYYLHQWSYIGFNCATPIFGDARVRQAISKLIPRKKINQRRYSGLARPAVGPFLAQL